MSNLKKILFIIVLFFSIYLLKSCVFGAEYSVQPFSKDSDSASFDSQFPLYAKSNKMILFPDALVVFKTNIDIENSNRFVLFSGKSMRLSDNSEFIVVPVSEVSSSQNYSEKFRFLDFNNVSTTNYYSFIWDWEQILFSSVNFYADSFSDDNLRGVGSGIFLGANNFDDINVEYFSRYVELTSVFATNTTNNTIYFKKSKNTTISNNDISLKAIGIKNNNTYTIFEYKLSDFNYDNATDIYYYNLSSSELSVISNNNIEYVQLNSDCWGGRSTLYNFCYLYIPDNSSEGPGGGDTPGGGGSTEDNDNINTNAIIEGQAQTTEAVRESTNAIKEQTEAINDNNNFIKDESISDDNFVLPDDSSIDISKQGIENIFDLLYNSFTSGEAQDIVLPVPFTSKNIVIPSDYLENIFNNSNFNFLLMFIHAFYYFIVSSFIVKDIQKKFDKIKSGNIENLQNDNIKADML